MYGLLLSRSRYQHERPHEISNVCPVGAFVESPIDRGAPHFVSKALHRNVCCELTACFDDGRPDFSGLRRAAAARLPASMMAVKTTNSSIRSDMTSFQKLECSLSIYRALVNCCQGILIAWQPRWRPRAFRVGHGHASIRDGLRADSDAVGRRCVCGAGPARSTPGTMRWHRGGRSHQ